MLDFERETVISYTDADDTATIITFNKAMLNKMDRICKQHPDTYKLVDEIIFEGKVFGKEYSFPKKLVSVRVPSARKMTDDQKEAASKRMKKTMKNKNKD